MNIDTRVETLVNAEANDVKLNNMFEMLKMQDDNVEASTTEASTTEASTTEASTTESKTDEVDFKNVYNHFTIVQYIDQATRFNNEYKNIRLSTKEDSVVYCSSGIADAIEDKFIGTVIGMYECQACETSETSNDAKTQFINDNNTYYWMYIKNDKMKTIFEKLPQTLKHDKVMMCNGKRDLISLLAIIYDISNFNFIICKEMGKEVLCIGLNMVTPATDAKATDAIKI